MNTFNINETVKIRLTATGIKVLSDFWAEYDICKTYTPDENGYLEMQLWHVMEVFGDSLRLGCDPPFETNILIDPGRLKLL